MLMHTKRNKVILCVTIELGRKVAPMAVKD